MKAFLAILLICYFSVPQLFALDSRSEMMVRYYENKPIIEKRKPIDLKHTFIEWGEGSWVKLNERGLSTSNGMLILDTFNLTYNSKQTYMMLKKQEVLVPSENILLTRHKNTLF